MTFGQNVENDFSPLQRCLFDRVVSQKIPPVRRLTETSHWNPLSRGVSLCALNYRVDYCSAISNDMYEDRVRENCANIIDSDGVARVFVDEAFGSLETPMELKAIMQSPDIFRSNVTSGPIMVHFGIVIVTRVPNLAGFSEIRNIAVTPKQPRGDTGTRARAANHEDRLFKS